jgi:DNA-binding MarR family transcriptional regulator
MMLNEAVSEALSGPIREAGLSLGTFGLLSAVKAGRGRVNQAELAERLGITPPSLCEAVRTATQRGLVEQSPDPRDKRAKMVTLTANGKAALDKVQKALQQLERELERQFSEKDLGQATRVLALAAEFLQSKAGNNH